MSSEGRACSPAAQAAYLDYMARLQAGDAVHFEAFCAERPTLAGELRELHTQFRQGLKAGAEHNGSERTDDYPSTVLERLGERRAAYARYVLKGEIDHGGQGVVVHVWDEDLRRALAMKVLLGKHEPRKSGTTPPVDARSLGRFLEEAQVTGQLDHPGVVPVHELGLDADGHVYFTMKLVKGETFRTVLEHVASTREGWTRTRALGVLQRVCEAMSYAHHKGVVHRDLKPANVMVGRFGEVYVMDWGLARVLGRPDAKDVTIAPEARTEVLHSELRERAEADDGAPLLTMDGDVVGTPAYMPPEQALARTDEIGAQSDVYAVGALLYHLLAGHMPYVLPGTRLSSRDIWHLVRRGPPEPIAGRAPDAPAELVAICERAMARELGERYASMRELSADLAAYVEHRVVSAYETGAWAETRKWVQRNRALASALAAAVVLLVAGLATSLVFKERSDEHARVAREQADDVLRLSALQDLEDVLAKADGLWPAHPQNIEACEAWLAEARKLVAGLAEHRAERTELRARALPRTEEKAQAQRLRHPRYAELERIGREVHARRGALDRSLGGFGLPIRAGSKEPRTKDPQALNAAAWSLVRPDRIEFGSEEEGLELALQAMDLVETDAERAQVGGTISYAYFALGLYEHALSAGREVLEVVPANLAARCREKYEALERAVALARSPEGRAVEEAKVAALEARVAELEAIVAERTDWTFPVEERETRWWHDQLSKLIEGLEELDAELLAEESATPEHGWSVPKRVAFARELRAGFASGGTLALAWERDLPAIRAAYPELELGPQTGLLPLGPDPATGLWEFAHLQTGEPATRGADGALVLTADTGLVLVLLPAGTFWMGSQRRNPLARNFDDFGAPDEAPPHEVALSAYFLSKYEMTQGQWMRMAGHNPSHYREETYSPSWNRERAGWSALHPVEMVTWFDATSMLHRLGLALPTEAQWEHGCRAGTTTTFWTGAEDATLEGAANVSDAFARAHEGEFVEWVDWDDGHTRHAPVGSYRPNAFGLHDVHGNVWEWCADGFDAGFYAESPRVDPMAPAEGTAPRVFRGGGYVFTARFARSADRLHAPPAFAGLEQGVRPAMTVAR